MTENQNTSTEQDYDEVARMIENLADCHAVCVQSITYVVESGSGLATPERVKALQDCADVCQLMLTMMLRESDRSTEMAGLCSQICTDCAEHCDGVDDEMLETCTEACQICAKSCQEMSNS